MERQSVTMKQRPETERPYEKCLKAGAESLTDGELLAVLIRCGTKNYSALELAFALLEESDFSSPEYIASYYMEEMRHLCVEKVMLLLLDGRHRLMKEILLSKGTANSSWVPVRTIFVEALRYEAVYMILIHNHPSGCPEPSREDLVITKQIKEAGELLGIPLSDHIIIGDKCYTSLREQQMM